MTKHRPIEQSLFPEEESLFPEEELYLSSAKQSHSSENESPFPRAKPQTAQEASENEYDLTELFDRLSQSTFRSRFHLSQKDRDYIAAKGLDTIRQHAKDFVAKRLAPAVIPNDGKQTPMHGHPVFLAQHATGCCCRGCFFKWHHIPAGRALTAEEQHYAVSVLMTWIENQLTAASNSYGKNAK